MSTAKAGTAKAGTVKVLVGGSATEDGQAFVNAWHSAEKGEAIGERVVSFETWDALARLLSKERLNLLRHLRRHPERSIAALATALRRQYRRVHEDVSLLEAAGLIERSPEGLRAAADGIEARIDLVA